MEDGISQGHHSNKLMFTLFGKSEGLDDAQPSWIESTIPRPQLMWQQKDMEKKSGMVCLFFGHGYYRAHASVFFKAHSIARFL